MGGSFEYPDALPVGPGRAPRGRGAGLQPGNRFEPVRLHVLGDHLDHLRQEAAGNRQETAGGAAKVETEVLPDHSRTIINRVDRRKSPDIGFDWTVNPYRGCEHGCIYCYARPTHEMLGFSCGLDFETKIMAKLDAPRLLRRELASSRWVGEPIVMSGVTDPYQPIEAKLRITRGCLEVFAECRQAVTLITKSRLILRDLDLLRELARHDAVHTAVSVTTLNHELAARMEPRASSPTDRLHTVAALADAGVPVTVMVAPVIPAVTDREMPAILKAASQAGATAAGYVLLRLPHQVKALFLDWLTRHFPDRAGHVESLIRSTRGGALYDPAYGKRHRGQGPFAAQIQQTFELFSRRYGLAGHPRPLVTTAFRRPVWGDQIALFDNA
ncbi:MAG: PA0069 family radical SAM protein [Phycisphaeraceae bacterium]